MHLALCARCRRYSDEHHQPRLEGCGRGAFSMEQLLSGPCSGPFTGYARATLHIRCCHAHFATEESAPQTSHSTPLGIAWSILETQNPRPHPAGLTQNLHFNKLPRDPVHSPVQGTLLRKPQQQSRTADWRFLLFSGGKREMGTHTHF